MNSGEPALKCFIFFVSNATWEGDEIESEGFKVSGIEGSLSHTMVPQTCEMHEWKSGKSLSGAK